MRVQRTERHTKIIVDFLQPFVYATPDEAKTSYRVSLTDAEVAQRLNASYAGHPDLSGFFTKAKVRTARIENWGTEYKMVPAVKAPEPAPEAEPAPAAAEPVAPVKPPVPDAVGCFWDRLDAIQLQLAALTKDLADHRSNVAHILDDQTAILSVIRNGVIAIHNEWTGKK